MEYIIVKHNTQQSTNINIKVFLDILKLLPSKLTDVKIIDEPKIIVVRNNKNVEIISMGHRNPQGLIYDVDNNTIILTEHGPQGGDEINLIEYLCRPEMEYLNYELSRDELTSERLRNYFEDTNPIMPWLIPYNLHISENILSKEIERVEYFYNAKNADINKVKNHYFTN